MALILSGVFTASEFIGFDPTDGNNRALYYSTSTTAVVYHS